MTIAFKKIERFRCPSIERLKEFFFNLLRKLRFKAFEFVKAILISVRSGETDFETVVLYGLLYSMTLPAESSQRRRSLNRKMLRRASIF